MKISKSLLQAIFAGVTLGAVATSCDNIKKETANIHFKTCTENCTIDHSVTNGEGEGGGEINPGAVGNCPACGMG